jgi:E3 ubiquitin-protein ligase RAD18
MKQWQVFKHLDACPGSSNPEPSKGGPSKETATIVTLNRTIRAPPKAADRLPALNYSMLKEPALRKKLTELGISATGSRQLLEKRHKEWITLWNANCDSSRPKKRAELMRDLDIWERTQGGRAQTFGRPANGTVAIKDKDFDGAAWAAKHDDSFKDLIAAARRSRPKVGTPATEGSATTAGEAPDPDGTGGGEGLDRNKAEAATLSHTVDLTEDITEVIT